MQRRQFMAAAGGLIAVGAGAIHPALAAPADAPEIALFDGRFEEARRFAGMLRARGATAFDIKGDLARLWYGPLRGALASERRPTIAGLATWADFVVARGLAAEGRLTLVHHAVHARGGDARPAGTLVSWIIS